MVDWFALILLGLASWRLASLLSQELPFQWLRSLVGVIHDEDGVPIAATNWFAEGAMCLWCTSMWAAAMLIPIWYVVPYVVHLLAISAFAILVDNWRTR